MEQKREHGPKLKKLRNIQQKNSLAKEIENQT